jgi:hypothetical protein
MWLRPPVSRSSNTTVDNSYTPEVGQGDVTPPGWGVGSPAMYSTRQKNCAAKKNCADFLAIFYMTCRHFLKLFFLTHSFYYIYITDSENNFNIFSFFYTCYIYVEKSNYSTIISFHKTCNKIQGNVFKNMFLTNKSKVFTSATHLNILTHPLSPTIMSENSCPSGLFSKNRRFLLPKKLHQLHFFSLFWFEHWPVQQKVS